MGLLSFEDLLSILHQLLNTTEDIYRYDTVFLRQVFRKCIQLITNKNGIKFAKDPFSTVQIELILLHKKLSEKSSLLEDIEKVEYLQELLRSFRKKSTIQL